MNVTAEKRATTNMRRIRKGDRFEENGIVFECAGRSEKIDSEFVSVPLRRTYKGSRQRSYVYNGDHRVRLIRR